LKESEDKTYINFYFPFYGSDRVYTLDISIMSGVYCHYNTGENNSMFKREISTPDVNKK
jgi:hypothetical protein